jgi:hypothetical protein
VGLAKAASNHAAVAAEKLGSGVVATSTSVPPPSDKNRVPAPRPHPSARAQNGLVRQTDFWERMRRSFGASYADSVARDHVLATLSGRTVEQALAEGEDAKTVWRAICSEFEVPSRERL